MAGKDPAGNFDSSFFRTQIHSVMQMGLPNSSSAQVIFRWTTTHTYSVQDPSGHPYNWGSTPATSTAHTDVTIPCVIQFKEKPIDGDPLGTFDPSQAIITVLDTDYTQIQGADLVLIGGNIYVIDVVGPPQGLFDVDIYQLFCTARDAT